MSRSDARGSCFILVVRSRWLDLEHVDLWMDGVVYGWLEQSGLQAIRPFYGVQIMA